MTSQITQPVLRAAQDYRVMNKAGALYMAVAVLLVSVLGFLWALRENHSEFLERKVLENGVRAQLIAADSI